MARKITGLTARDQHVTARFRSDTTFDLDAMRGPTSRSRFLEYLIAQEKRRRDSLKEPKPPLVPPRPTPTKRVDHSG